MKIALTGGGTGGHLVIAKALQEALSAQGHTALFIGSTSGQDRMWFEGDPGFEACHFMATTGVVNQRGWRKLRALWRIFRAMWQSRALLKRHKVDAVVSVGGFSAAPASLAALSLSLPLFIHEQNAATGRLNRLLRPYCRAFYSSYDETSPVRDYPVRPDIFATARVRERVESVIFLGGSQGAAFINDLALRVAPLLRDRGIGIIHQCGERDYERVRAAYEAAGIEAELVAFTKQLPELLSRSDLAVSRAGASTLWELCACGIPAFYIPFPHAAQDHQYDNAMFLAERDLAWCERQGEGVHERLEALLDEPLETRSRALMQLCRPGGAEAIVASMKGVLDHAG